MEPAAPIASGTPQAPGTPRGPVALSLIATSLGTYWFVAFAGSSAVSHALPGGGASPPYSLVLHPAPLVVVALLWAATLAGGAGTWLALRAVRGGWTPAPHILLAAAAVATVAFVIVPPVNSDDVYSYAAYGRMAATGRDPYTTTAQDLPADPVAREVTKPWRDTPTVYGPIATAEQTLVMRAAGRSVRLGVVGLSALGALAFLATAGILDRYAGDAAARTRAALCWALNPLLLFQLVGGAHLDTLGILALVLAIGLAESSRTAAAGAAIGAAIAVKLTGGIAAIGLAWSLRHEPRRLAQLVAGGVLIVVPSYLLAGGTTAFGQARKASRFVSFASWWRPIVVALETRMDSGPARQVVSTLALLAFLVVARLLLRVLPPTAPGLERLAGMLFAVTLAWLVTAAYTLPWYAAWAWPLLALMAAGDWDHVLLAWTAALTIAYIPGRDVQLPAGLAGMTSGLRSAFGPAALLTILVATIVLAARTGGSADPAA
ncbi:MAG: hypothetical protein ABI912_00860 [Actinomycetota bacterium]